MPNIFNIKFILMNLKFSHYPYISTFLHSTTTVPQQWIKDIKYVEDMLRNLVLDCYGVELEREPTYL